MCRTQMVVHKYQSQVMQISMCLKSGNVYGCCRCRICKWQSIVLSCLPQQGCLSRSAVEYYCSGHSKISKSCISAGHTVIYAQLLVALHLQNPSLVTNRSSSADSIAQNILSCRQLSCTQLDTTHLLRHRLFAICVTGQQQTAHLLCRQTS